MSGNYKKISASIMDSEGVQTLEKESIDMNLYEHVMEIKETVARVETKVDIHNNYESRIRFLEKNLFRALGALGVLVFLTSLAVAFVVKYI